MGTHICWFDSNLSLFFHCPLLPVCSTCLYIYVQGTFLKWIVFASIQIILMHTSIRAATALQCLMTRRPYSMTFRSFVLASSTIYGDAPSSVPVATICSQLSLKLKIPVISASCAATFNGLILNRCADTNVLQLSWGGAAQMKEKPFHIDFTSQLFQRRGKKSRVHSTESFLIIYFFGITYIGKNAKNNGNIFENHGTRVILPRIPRILFDGRAA